MKLKKLIQSSKLFLNNLLRRCKGLCSQGPKHCIKLDDKFERGKLLKIGDVVNDCRFIDSKIKFIIPDIPNGRIVDWTLEFEDGFQCSWMHCCNLPEEIPDYLKEAGQKEWDRRLINSP